MDEKMPIKHVPVLMPEVIEYLMASQGGHFIDGTLGMGGHAEAILNAHPENRLLAIDRDPHSLAIAQLRLARFGDRVSLVEGNYDQLQLYASRHNWLEVDGILLDLGVSTYQLMNAERGFSFQVDGPLDMRMNKKAEISAKTLINSMSTAELTSILRRYGEEPQARRIAMAIVRQVQVKPIETTMELTAMIRQAVRCPKSGYQSTIARCFQAIRIAVNQELHHLSIALTQAIDILRPGGRLAVISFHSLEDRMVKDAIRLAASSCICPPGLPICCCGKKSRLRIITKKPITPRPGNEYLEKRPVAAKLRVAEKI